MKLVTRTISAIAAVPFAFAAQGASAGNVEAGAGHMFTKTDLVHVSQESQVSDRDKKISELLDRDEIRRLAISYAHYVRLRAYDKIVALYAPDGVFDQPADIQNGAEFKGHEEIAKNMARGIEAVDPWPFAHNHVIEFVDDSHADGYVYAEIRMGSEQMRTTHVVVYTDQYVKIDGVWKFQSRRAKATPIPVAAANVTQ